MSLKDMKKYILCSLIIPVIVHPGRAQIRRDTIKISHGGYEIMAAFPGGDDNWKIYLKQHFKANEVLCKMPVRDPAYTETAMVQFKILKDGTVTAVFCRNANSINSALKNEAVRLIEASPRWIPAEHNKRLMNDFRIEKISITVSPLYL